MMIRGSGRFFPVLMVTAMGASHVCAQSGTKEADSLRTYRLSEIVVGGEVSSVRSMETVRRISIASIVKEDASSAAELVRLIPSAHLQTNSRGESLIYIRSAGERQVAVFFDGALLNIPWDYRVDMSLIPVGMLGGMAVSRGVPSVIYGTNVIGGAVNLQSRSLERTGSLTEFTAQMGTQSSSLLRGTYLRRVGGWRMVANGSFFSTDGIALPRKPGLAYNQTGNSVRTNTDRRIGSLFLRLGRKLDDGSEYGLSLMHIDAEKGVAPEGHIDPLLDRVRFWRYSGWRNTMIIANAGTFLPVLGDVRGTVWLGRFSQRIDRYDDASYDHVTDLQQDWDNTSGLRFTAQPKLGSGLLHLAVNLLSSTHTQTDQEFTPEGNDARSFKQRFRQHVFSMGAEYESAVSARTALLLGVSLDGNATPETGDKPDRKTETALGITTGVRYDISDNNLIRFSAGRKVRFPTMRELFGEALERFQLNPDLRPESSYLGEISFEHRGEILSGEIVTFFRRTFDTIDQEIVDDSGIRKRKRINLDGSRVWGFEVAGIYRIIESLVAEGHIAWMAPDGLEDNGARPLNEKPNLLGTVTLNLSTRRGDSFQLSIVQTGKAYGLNLENEQVVLPSSTVINLRVAGRRYFESNGIFVELYSGISNVTDEVTLRQLGLPGAGREARAGISVSF